MRTADDFARIRQPHAAGHRIREIGRDLGGGRDTAREALANPQPEPYTLARPRSAPVFDAVRPIVDDILTQDQTAPPKQRHTAAQIFRRLVSEHNYTGGYDQVRRSLQKLRRRRAGTSVPLEHPPGHRPEADVGHTYVDLPDGGRQVPVLVATGSYSNCPFAIALPAERTEAVPDGLVEAFTLFGCVPRERWWDNPRTVARLIHRGRERTLHPRYLALARHHAFAPRSCMPATPTEKPRVEKRVQDLQRPWATPVPRAAGHADLNAHLLRQCLAARARPCGGNARSVAARFEHDRAAASPGPTRSFDPCVTQPAEVDKYRCVRFDRNRYSVLSQLDRIGLLIVDELGHLSFSRGGAELLFQVLADRYERRSVRVTSNLALSEWGTVFPGDRVTAALVDRLTHRCEIFEMNGESYRFRESMKAEKQKDPKKGS